MVAQKGFVQAAAFFAFDDFYRLAPPVAVHAFERVDAAVVHGGGCRHGAGVEGLHLISAKTIALEPERQIHHVLVARARVRGDEVGDEKLLFACLGAVLLKQLFELVVIADGGLHHF